MVVFCPLETVDHGKLRRLLFFFTVFHYFNLEHFINSNDNFILKTERVS